MTAETEKREDGVWATFSEAPLAVKVILLGVLLNRLSGFLNIFLVLFLVDEGYSAGQAAIALGVFGAGTVVSYLIGSVLAERLGIRNITVISVVSSAVLVIALLYLPSFTTVLVVVALVGTVSQAYWPASVTLLSDLTPEYRQVMILAMYRFAVNVGASAAPLIGYALYHLNGDEYFYVFWAQALLALVYAVLAVIAVPNRRPAEAIAAVDDAKAQGLSSGYRAVFKDRRYLVFLLAAFFYTAVYMQYLSTLPLDVKQTGMDTLWYSVAVSINGIAVILFELPLTKFSQRMPIRLIVCIAFTLVGVGMALYGLPLAPAVIIIGTLIWTFGEMIGAPRVFSYPAVVAPTHLKTYYIGAFQFVFGLGIAVGQAVGVALYATMGRDAWFVIALGSVLSVVFAYIALAPKAHAVAGDLPEELPVARAQPSDAAVVAKDSPAD